MRPLFPFLLCLALAGCAGGNRTAVTGINRAAAIRIAQGDCVQYPSRFAYVDHAEWNEEGHFWMVALTDRDGDHGRAFKINPAGEVIDSHIVDRSGDNREYGSSPRRYGAGWYQW